MHWTPAFLINEDGAECKYRTEHSHPVAGSPSPTPADSRPRLTFHGVPSRVDLLEGNSSSSVRKDRRARMWQY
jgi:hypothetical protein